MTNTATPICARFNRHAAHYDDQAALQRAIAWRLAHHTATLPLPSGPAADLGAGTGLVSQALQQLVPQLAVRQVDGSAALLARNPLANGEALLLWNLEHGLPDSLQNSALLVSSFSLQWLSRPAQALQDWARALRPGGWLVLAVPVLGCFPQWHEAARQARVPCTARSLPEASALVAATAELLNVQHQRELVFSRHYGPGGRTFLRQLKHLGAGHSDQQPLSPSQWRQLLHHWPADDHVSWRILMLIAQR